VGRLWLAVAAMTYFLVPTCFFKVAWADKLFLAAKKLFVDICCGNFRSRTFGLF